MTGHEPIVGGKYDVFISYAHADREEDGDRSPAESLAAMLEAESYSVWWDRELLAGQDWARQLAQKVGFARKVVALCSPRWLASDWCRKEEFRAYEIEGKIIPVIIEACVLPDRIARLQRIDAVGRNLAVVKMQITAAIGPPSEAPPPVIPAADPARVQLTLPSGTSHLFGRDVELSILANAWNGTGPGKINAVVFHAIGGAGKSALVRHFVDGLAAKGYPGAAKVYGWSAYSQGSGDNRETASAEGFIADALGFFGHDLAAKPITDATERGRTLARLVRAQRTLLILDGLEPLQDQPLVNGGRLKDRGLAALITSLADDNPGLLVITSRQELPELANRPLVVNRALDRLDLRAGAELLKHLGVHGRERELMDAVRDVGGHALSISLLGTWLANVCAGDVTRRDTFRFGDMVDEAAEVGTDDTARQARRAQAVMRAYEAAFAELAAGPAKGKGAIELMLMRIVGLFNRPADAAAIATVLAEPAIPGLTDAWHAMSPQRRQSNWGFALARLRKLKLLIGADAPSPSPRPSRGEGRPRTLDPGEGQPQTWSEQAAAPHPNPLLVEVQTTGRGDWTLDAHPVVRQHFGDELARTTPEAFREANLRLYRHYSVAGLPPAFRSMAGLGLVQLPGMLKKPEDFAKVIKALADGTFPEEAREQLPSGLREITASQMQDLSSKFDDEAFAVAQRAYRPNTLAEMEPLFHAIAHGCAAGLHLEVWNEVCWDRVRRGNEAYIVHQLGAFSADLGALAHFFAPPWRRPHPSLRASSQAAALDFAAFALRGLGRLRDAIEPMAAGAELRVAQKDWRNAAAGHSNLSELRLTLGDVAEAVAAGRQGVAHADTSGDAFQRMGKRTTLADALHRAGDGAEAERLFREAEAMQAEDQPSLDRLYSLPGYRFCDLLLGRDAAEEVRERYDQIKKWSQSPQWRPYLLDDALYELLAGRAEHALALPPVRWVGAGDPTPRGDGGSPLGLAKGSTQPTRMPVSLDRAAAARRHLDAAVEGLRRAGREDHIPRGLLARAAFRIDAHVAGLPEGDLDGAVVDLTETQEIASRGGMRLHIADYYLTWGRLVLAYDPTLSNTANRQHAETCWREAHTLVQATGYHRRDGELAALRAAIDGAG